MSERKKVGSIVRAVNILKIISDGNNQLSKISKLVRLEKGTVHRILKTLEDTDMIKQDPINHLYFLGTAIIGMSSSFYNTHDFLISCSHRELTRLRDFSRETVNLQIRIGLQRICIEEYESPNEIKFTSGRGASQPIHLGSAGKLLLAEMSDEDIEILVKKICFVPVSTNSITDKTSLLNEINKIRKQGYSVSFSERLQGSASISVPIQNYPCRVALSILGLENRFDKESMKRCLSEMFKSSKKISDLLSDVRPCR